MLKKHYCFYFDPLTFQTKTDGFSLSPAMLLANFNISCFRLKQFFVFIKLPKLSLPFLLWTFLPSCQAFEQRCFNVLYLRFSLREIFVKLVNGVK